MNGRPGITAETLAEVAFSYFLGNQRQAEIARRFKVTQSTVTRWLDFARERAVIAFNVDKSFFWSGSEDYFLSRKLRDAFGLSDCSVVNVDASDSDEDLAASNLHLSLANFAGAKVCQTIASSDHVLVTGGRAIHRLAQRIRRSPPPRRDIRITPGCGRLWLGAWQIDGPDILERPMDADDSALVFAAAFENEPGTRFSQIGYPLYLGDNENPETIKRDHFVALQGGHWNWGLSAPNKSYCGCGVLDKRSGHRIGVYVESLLRRSKQRRVGDLEEPFLSRCIPSLKKVMGIISENQLPMIGDIGNRVFPVLLLPSQFQHQNDLKKIRVAYIKLKTELDNLNRGALVLEWAHFRGIDSVQLIAGGQLKRAVLFTLLLAGRLYPRKSPTEVPRAICTELITDIESAKALLSEIERLENNPDLMARYRDLMDSMKLFLDPA